MKKKAGFIIAAPHSGAGKTAVTLALLTALRRRGLKVQPFKCGPDFIDPTLHQFVTGRVSRNLDLRMCGEKFVFASFQKQAKQADISIVEGVMGLFDGGTGSSAALAKSLRLPVVLVIDVKGAAESIAAVIKGFETLDPDLAITGVILNRVGSPRHKELLEGAIRQFCQATILGYLPRDPAFTIKERHLGLHMGGETPLSETQLNAMAESIEEHIDIEALLGLHYPPVAAGQLVSIAPAQQPLPEKRTLIAVARDQAFCFLYQDNLDILRESGAELVFFSPISDHSLPDNIKGVYLCGGYPELFAKELAANSPMLQAIKAWAESNGPIYAECGGFMYLCQGIVDLHNNFQAMAGIFPTKARLKDRLAGLGYRQVKSNGTSMFGENQALHGHEFHYSDIDAMPPHIKKAFATTDGKCQGYQINNTLAGYLHLHFGKTPQAAAYFIEFCQQQERQC